MIIINNKSILPTLIMKNLFGFLRGPLVVKLAITPDVLAELIEKGQLHATDFKCLDLGSKHIVGKIFLTLAKAKLNNLISG